MILILITHAVSCHSKRFDLSHMQIQSQMKTYSSRGQTLIHRTLEQTNYSLAELFQMIPSDRDLENPFHTSRPLDILPLYVGSLKHQSILNFSLPCFTHYSGTANISSSGATLLLNVTSPTTLLCSDFLIFMTSERVFVQPFVRKGFHTITIKKWASDAERLEAEYNGIRVFRMDQSLLPFLLNSFKLLKLILSLLNSSEKQLIQFYSSQMNISFVDRDESANPDIARLEASLKTGDVLACFSMSGLSGINTLLTGALVSHVALVMKEGKDVFVYETTAGNTFEEKTPWGDGFRRTPFQKWYTAYHKHNYLVALLPLSSSLSSHFNVTAARNWFDLHARSFSIRTFPYVQIDTPDGNIPSILSQASLELVVHLFEKIKPSMVKELVADGISKRLEMTQVELCEAVGVECACTSLADCMEKSAQLGMGLWDVAAIPEDDAWLYEDGESIFCSSLVIHMLAAGGVLKNVTLNANEFSPKDVTMVWFSFFSFHSSKYSTQKRCLVVCRLCAQWTAQKAVHSVRLWESMN
ncbi:putative Inositol-1,4,5-trisphosphate 5-phosphatase 4 [Blattamonas nauphoetae]|uniref:Inositol-1,4,5-trisphosphate 5-phosphatase 4 n=1 Tax=Blattamonas nauphoetae TaxID=2049346 RepID=A0ABQ9YFB4_9EUKA|nr:putative Inositol-1,4,5-trisphosphate 5-phosphatase 4 [Blattamonas nauphoetae]